MFYCASFGTLWVCFAKAIFCNLTIRWLGIFQRITSATCVWPFFFSPSHFVNIYQRFCEAFSFGVRCQWKFFFFITFEITWMYQLNRLEILCSIERKNVNCIKLRRELVDCKYDEMIRLIFFRCKSKKCSLNFVFCHISNWFRNVWHFDSVKRSNDVCHNKL